MHSPCRRPLLLSIPFLTAFALLGGTPCADAQAVSGDLLGTCFDASHAIIASAEVDVVSETTNVHFHGKTDERGEYHFVNLSVGKYDVTVNAPGFAPTRQIGIEVKLNQPATLDLTLASGVVGQSVQVTEAAVTLDTTTAQISNDFTPAAIINLPLASIGSGVLNMSLLDAGIQMTGGLGLGGGPSVSGERPYNNNFTIEGVDNNNKSVHSPLITVPNDAVADFSVLQNQFSPEFGHSSGGQFNQVVMSGSNHFHGRTYEYFENRNLNALDYSYKRSGTYTNPRYDNNRFGGQVGGPILHDRLFFFQNFEYNPIGQSGGSTSVLAPTSAGFTTLNGLSGLSSTNLGQLEKYLSAASTQSTTITVHDGSGQAYAVPVGPLAIIAPSFTNNLTSVSSADYTISSKDSMRLRYIYYKQDTPDTSPSLSVFYGTSPTRSHLINLSEYHTFSPRLTNESRLGFNRYDNETPSPNFTFPGLDTFPSFSFEDISLQFGPDGNTPEFTIQNTYQALDNLVWQRGKHDIRIGVEGRKYISPQRFVQRAHGDYEYTVLDYYLRDLSPDVIGERSVGVPGYDGNQIAFYAYAADNWRVTPNLTLNYGGRYEYTTIPAAERLQSLNAIADVAGLLTFETPTAPKLNFAPRGGFAWTPRAKTDLVVRGGVGLAYDVLYDNIGTTSLPPELNKTEDVPSLVNQTANFLASGALPAGSGQETTYATAAAARAATSAAIANHQLYPYSFNYNLGVQKSFARDYLADVRYVGSRGVHLNVQDRINRRPVVSSSQYLPTYLAQPSQGELDALTTTLAGLEAQSTFDPTYAAAGFDGGNVTEFLPLGASNYQGLQTQLNKRFAQGVQFQVGYTYSKNIDNDSADFYASDLDPRRVENVREIQKSRALSSLDRRHRFTFGGYYDVPWFAHSSNWYARNLLGNYIIAPFYQIESPEHATVQAGQDANLNNDSAGDRAVLNPSGSAKQGSAVTALTNSAGDTVAYLATNSNARYIQAGIGSLTNAGRNTIPLARLNNLDTTVSKGFSIREHYRVEFSAQAFNVFNHHQFIPGKLNDIGSYGGYANTTLYPSSTHFEDWSYTFSSHPRSMQLVGKISF